MAGKKKEDKVIGAFIGDGVGGVIGVLGGPAGVTFGWGIGAWLGHAIENWLDSQP